MEKNIIPPSGSGRKRKYNFRVLKEYGDSLFIRTDNIHAVRDAAFKFAKYNGIKVVTRAKTGGVRVYHAGTAVEKKSENITV